MTLLKLKKCTTCGTEKPVKQFYKDSSKSDGYRGVCKSCTYAKKSDGLKKCSTCKERKNPDDFYSGSRRCIPCDNSRKRNRRITNTSDISRIAKCLEATLQIATNKKICTSCGVEQNLQDFRRREKNISGRSNVCKTCLRRRNKEKPTEQEQTILNGLAKREKIFLNLIQSKDNK